MTASAPDPALADPMLRVLRERHPEVDIVVLPQTAPAPRAPDLTPEQRGTLAGALERSLDDLLDRLAAHPAAHPTSGQVRRDATWHSDEWDQTWHECVAVVGPLGEGDNMALLRATGRALVGLGWRTRPVPGDRPRLEARRGGLSATATVRPDTLVLTLRTAKVRVADGEAS